MRKPISPISPISPIGPISLISLISLILFTACSSGDAPGEDIPTTPAVTPDPVETQDAITFASGLASNEDITRAGGLEEKTTTFHVWAYKNMEHDNTNGYGGLQTVIDGYTVNWIANTANTTNSNTNDWEYVNQQPTGGIEQSIKYWDWSAKAYRFFGVTGDATPTFSESDQAYKFEFSGLDAGNVAAAPYYSKLWFSNGNPIDYADKQFGKPVKLEFVKPFARVRFMFTFAEGLSFGRRELSAISFRPTDNTKSIPSKGTVTIAYPVNGNDIQEKWSSTPTGWIEDLEIDYYEEDPTYDTGGNTSPELYDNSPQHWYTVLPVESQGSYTVSVVVVGGDPKTAVVPAEFMTWAPGFQYTYRFKITEGGGVTLDNVQVAINSWSNGGDIEHPVYNW